MATEKHQWETRLKPQLVDVAEILSPRRNRIPSRLFSKGLISEDDLDRFDASTKVETDLALDILHLLRRRQRPGSFDTFCDVLLQTKDDTLLDVERQLRPRVQRQDNTESHDLAEQNSLHVTQRQLQHSSDNLYSKTGRPTFGC